MNPEMRSEEEYQELVTKNHNLIYHCIRKHGVELSEYYDVLAIALCNAARYYREDGEAGFAQYAMVYMENALRGEYNHQRYQCRDVRNTLSLTDYESDNGDNDKTEIMQNHHDVVKSVILRDTFDRAYRRFTRKQKEVFSLFAYGYKQVEIAKMTGVTHQQINAQMKQIRSKLLLEIA